jgi:two-component system C4-dicarboxylate transport response regulator DctD
MAQATTTHSIEPVTTLSFDLARPLDRRRGAILVVEDHKDVRIGLSELLELNGYLVADAADATHAIEHLHAQPRGFALMLLDLMLPGGVTGGDLRALQLADPEISQIPVVVVSACEPDPEAEARLRPAAWLEKPFRAEHLLDVVRRFVAPEPGTSLSL